MEKELDGIAGDAENFLAPFHIWKKFSYMKGSIMKPLKIGMSTDAQLYGKHFTNRFLYWQRAFQHINSMFSLHLHRRLCCQKTQIAKASALVKIYSTLSLPFSLSLCRADLTDSRSFVFITAVTHCKRSRTWLGNSFCPFPPGWAQTPNHINFFSLEKGNGHRQLPGGRN